MAEKEAKAKEKKPTALKRVIQNQRRELENRTLKSQVRTALRAFEEAAKDKKAQVLNQIYSLLDKGVKKGVYKGNTVNRTKSRLSAKI